MIIIKLYNNGEYKHNKNCRCMLQDFLNILEED